MPLHGDAAAKDVVIRVKTGDGPALLRGKKPFHHGAALLVQFFCDPLPIERINAPGRFPVDPQLADPFDPNHVPATRKRTLDFQPAVISAASANKALMRAPPFQEAHVFVPRPSDSPTMRRRCGPRD